MHTIYHSFFAVQEPNKVCALIGCYSVLPMWSSEPHQSGSEIRSRPWPKSSVWTSCSSVHSYSMIILVLSHETQLMQKLILYWDHNNHPHISGNWQKVCQSIQYHSQSPVTHSNHQWSYWNQAWQHVTVPQECHFLLLFLTNKCCTQYTLFYLHCWPYKAISFLIPVFVSWDIQLFRLHNAGYLTNEGLQFESVLLFHRNIIPRLLQKNLYCFLRHGFAHWPLDHSFRVVSVVYEISESMYLVMHTLTTF